jgi:hypothetical protein
VLANLDADYLATKIHDHCGSLMREFFPDVPLVTPQRAVASPP